MIWINSNSVSLEVPQVKKTIRLKLHPKGEYVSDRFRDLKKWEPTETSCVCNIVRPGDKVLDVGANIGYYSVLFSHLVGLQGEVIAFEPHPLNYRLLVKNIKLNKCKNVTTRRLAVSNNVGSVKLFCSENNFGDHRLYPFKNEGYVEVQSIPLGDEIDSCGGVDFIKIDCQGAEEQIFAGMLRHLSLTGRPKGIIFEFWPVGMRENGTDIQQFLASIGSLPYEIIDIGRWAGRPVKSSVESLLKRVNEDLSPDEGLFTNILLLDKESDRFAEFDAKFLMC